MSDAMDIIGSMDVEEEITFLDKPTRDVYCRNIRERSVGHYYWMVKGPLDVKEVDDKKVIIRGKIIDVAPAVIMSTMMDHPSSIAITATADAMKEKYGYTCISGEGEIILTDKIIRSLLGEDYGKLSTEIELPGSGITVELTPPSDLDSFALTLAGNRPIWQPNKCISEGFAFADGISDETWEYLTKSPACVTMVGTDTVMVTGRAIDVCNTMMGCMLSSGALRANIDNVGNHLAEKYGFRYPVDGAAPWMVRTSVRQGKAYIAQRQEKPQKVTPFTSPLQPIQAKWEDGFVGESVPKEVEEKYDRAVEIYNELNSARLPGPERATLLAELQTITNSGVLLYALKRHHYDVE